MGAIFDSLAITDSKREWLSSPWWTCPQQANSFTIFMAGQCPFPGCL